MANLGKALSIIVRANVDEDIMHSDVDAFGAPSECHGSVSKGESRRLRQARRHAKAASGLTARQFSIAIRRVYSDKRNDRPFERLFMTMHEKHNPFINH